MAFQLTQVIECSQAPETFDESEEKVQIGILKIGDEEHRIFEGITKIGRLASCDIYLQDINVSKLHSEIEANKKNVFICDLNSSNKTRLNDVILRPNRFYEVKDGAILKFGIIEGKFSLLKSSDKSFSTPETPECSLNSRNQSIYDDDSFIQNTPAIDAGRFRRPQLPIQKKVYKQHVINDISLLETQVQSKENVQNLETQCSMTEISKETRSASKSHIQELETQVGEVNDIEDAETQFSIEENETQGFDRRPNTSKSDIHDLDTQVIESRRNIPGISGEKRRIQDLETQFDEPQGDIQDMQTQILEFKNNKECIKNKKDASREKIDGKRELERQKRIEDLNTQICEANVSETAEKIGEEEIYDLPTQPNWDYLENLKKQELLKDSQSPSSSPDLLGTRDHVIIAESDEETVEEAANERIVVDDDKYRDIDAIVKNNVFSDVIDTGDDDINERKPEEIENCDESGVIEDNFNDFERTKSSKKKAETSSKFKRNGIISESDSDEDDNDMKNEEKVLFRNSKDLGKSQSNRPSSIKDLEKNEIKEAKNGEKAKSNSQLRDKNDFHGDDEEKENQPTSSMKSTSKNASDAKDSESLPGDSGTSINFLDNLSDSETDYEDCVEIERQNSLKLPKANFEKSCNGELRKIAEENEKMTSIAPEIRKLMDTPKRTDEDDLDSDDSSSAATQLIVVPKPHEVKKRLRTIVQEEAPLTQMIPVSPGSPRNEHSESELDNTTTYDDMEPTQKLDFGKRKSPVDDLEPTQKLDFGKRRSSVDDLEPTQKLDFGRRQSPADDLEPTQKLDFGKRKSPVDDLEPTQKLDFGRRKSPVDDLEPTQKLDFGRRKSPADDLEPTQKLDFGKRKSPADDLEPTQKLDFGRRESPVDDLEPTQKLDFGKRKSPVDDRNSGFRGFDSSLISRYPLNDENDDDETDEDMAPTQKIELPKRFQSRRLSLKSPLANSDHFKVSDRSRREVIDELPRTQVLDDNETRTQLISNDVLAKARAARKPDDDDDDDAAQTQLINVTSRKNRIPDDNDTQTQLINDGTSRKAHANEILDDDDTQTQLINCDSSTKIRSKAPSPAKIPIESPTTRSRTRTKPTIDKTPIRKLDRGDTSARIITSTPVRSPSPTKRRKFSLSLKQSKKETDISEKNEPLFENHQRSRDSSDDSIEQKLDINSKSSLTKSEISGPSHSASSSLIREKYGNRKRNSKGKALKKKIGREKSSAHISDSSDDEDMDYAKVNAMADRFIATSQIGEDQSSSRVTRQISTIEASNNSAFSAYDKSKRSEDNIPSKEAYSPLKEVPDVVEKNSSQARSSRTEAEVEKEAEVTKKPQGRGKMPKLMKREEIPSTEEKPEIKKETVKKRKLQSNESSNSSSEYGKRGKKMKESNSDESTVGAASQEVQRILEGNESLQDSPSRSIRTKARSFEAEKMTFCVLFTGIEDEDGSRANGVVALGGSITNDPHKATILVTDKVRRTIKFFCAVSRSILIASVDWLDASIKAGRFQDPKKYLLHDAAAESKFRFSLNKSLQRAQTKKLLEGFTVLLTPKIVGPSIADLKTMVQVSGGKPLVRAPRAWTKTTIIISCEEDLPYVKRILAKTKSQVPIVTIEFLLSGILRQQLEFDEFSLAL